MRNAAAPDAERGTGRTAPLTGGATATAWAGSPGSWPAESSSRSISRCSTPLAAWASKLVRVAIPLIFTTVIILVAVARMAVGAHDPSDILAGLLGGIGFVALFAWLTEILARRRASST